MGDEHVKEASWVVHNTTGFSSYLYGVGYSIETFSQEVAAIVEHIKKST
jgi:hypothetical protein